MSRPPTPKRKGTIWREADGNQTAIYEAETDGLHMLNATALAIWELCDGHTNIEEMVSAISELTEMSIGEAREDVTITLATLEGLGLVGYPDD